MERSLRRATCRSVSPDNLVAIQFDAEDHIHYELEVMTRGRIAMEEDRARRLQNALEFVQSLGEITDVVIHSGRVDIGNRFKQSIVIERRRRVDEVAQRLIRPSIVERSPVLSSVERRVEVDEVDDLGRPRLQIVLGNRRYRGSS